MQYDNTPTVVAVLVETPSGSLVLVRRANEPKAGLLALPGGYHMRGETWQEAGAREVYEETGYAITDPNASIKLVSMVTDEYGNNLVIARCRGAIVKDTTWVADPEETQSVYLAKKLPAEAEVAFPRHYVAMQGVLK